MPYQVESPFSNAAGFLGAYLQARQQAQEQKRQDDLQLAQQAWQRAYEQRTQDLEQQRNTTEAQHYHAEEGIDQGKATLAAQAARTKTAQASITNAIIGSQTYQQAVRMAQAAASAGKDPSLIFAVAKTKLIAAIGREYRQPNADVNSLIEQVFQKAEAPVYALYRNVYDQQQTTNRRGMATYANLHPRGRAGGSARSALSENLAGIAIAHDPMGLARSYAASDPANANKYIEKAQSTIRARANQQGGSVFGTP